MKEIINDILSVISPKEKKRLRLYIFFNTVVNLADVFSVVCLLFVIKFYTQPSTAYTNNTLLGKILPGNDSIIPILFLIAMFTIKNVAAHFVYKAQFKFVGSIAVRISQQNLFAYLEGPYSDYANIDSAVYVNKIIYQPVEFAQYVLQGFQQIIIELLLVAFSITALLMYNAKLFLIVILTLLPAIVILSWLNKKKLAKIKQNIKVVAENSLQYLNEALKGYVESNIYDRNSFFVARHEAQRKKLGGYIADMQTTQDMPARFFEVFAILGLFVLIVAIKYSATINNADVVMLGAFMAAAYKIIPSISKIINLAGQVRAYRHTIDGAVKDYPGRQNKNVLTEKISSIEFSNIHFSYNDLKVMNSFSCLMQSGNFIGISGASGSGKTTMLQLLLGFYAQEAGAILFNGKDVEDNERMAFWGRIAYLKQEPFILHDSILNNIVLFEENYDQKRLDEIIEVTGLKDIAGRFSNGIYTPLMEAGKNISGGQRQRVAIARALYKEANVILLDEPFSELDEASEIKMLEYFKQLALGGKMVVLISHSPASFGFCDTIIKM